MISNNEMLWVQIHIPYSKPALIGRCYRPPSSALCYLDELCTNIDRARDKGKGVFILGDFNVDWFSKDCPFSFMTSICHLSQIVDQATRVSFRKNGAKISTCIDLIFTNVPELCSRAVSRAVGSTVVIITRLSYQEKLKRLKQGLGSYKDGLFKNLIQNRC